MTWRVDQGDCVELIAAMAEASVDAIVCDPPYGLGFAGNDWDRPWADGLSGVSDMHALQGWHESWARQALRVLKPGGHLLAFGATRVYHRLAAGVEDAGFDIRDCLMWLYGTGFAKTPNLAGEWQGWGTTLKPGYEPIVLARKQLAGTVAANVDQHGTGALNVDGCRIPAGEDYRERCDGKVFPHSRTVVYGKFAAGKREVRWSPAGRWPANLVLDERAAEMLDQQAPPDRDRLGPSRFFYVVKTSSAERHAGVDGHGDATNHHPTVKPIELMRWLVRLVTPPGGTVLDPFAGSGTTGCAAVLEGFDFVGLEREPKFVDVARTRIGWWAARPRGVETKRAVAAQTARQKVAEHGQGLLWSEEVA